MAFDYDHTFKLVIIGDSDVGKTSLLLRLTENSFHKKPPTLGVDFKIKRLELDGEKIKLNIWDTAGQERFRVITKTYYRNADGVMVMYDVTNTKSFENVQTWLQEIDKNADVALCRILVGTKDDDPVKKAVSTEDAWRFARSLGIDAYETSAKDDINVQQVFEAITKLMVKRKREIAERAEESEKRIRVNTSTQADQKTRKKCC